MFAPVLIHDTVVCIRSVLMEDANWDAMLWRRRGVSTLLLCWMVAERESNFVLCLFCLLAAVTVTVDGFNINIYKMMVNTCMYV